jgi:hypothetical protein
VFFLLVGMLGAEVGLVGGMRWALLAAAGCNLVCAVTLASLRPSTRRPRNELEALRHVHDLAVAAPDRRGVGRAAAGRRR